MEFYIIQDVVVAGKRALQLSAPAKKSVINVT
jgi:DNA-directed RNA polymerase subunit K/omega